MDRRLSIASLALVGSLVSCTGPSASRPTAPDASAPSLCARARADDIHDLFCADAGSPKVTGILDLEGLFSLRLDLGYDGTPIAADASPGSYYAFLFSPIALLGHSTGLFGALVSPINPRAIIIGNSTILAFHRGVQEVEFASVDRRTGGRNFYLLSFAQACSDAPAGCTPGDLYTPRIESNWTRVQLRDEDELANTPLDCRQCHARGRASPVLLMREFQGPWTHFFDPDQPPSDYPEPTGSDLLRDYLKAKGDESYAGVPGGALRNTLGQTLEDAVSDKQPLTFDGAQIVTERWPHDEDAGYAATPERSPTWYAAYEGFKRGENLALPHFDPRPTDPAKQAALTDAYARYRAGTLAAEALPDLANIFPDDPQVRAEIGLQTEPGATPAQALVQACGPCHNDVLDQSLTRARFNIALSRMTRAELDLAMARIQAGRGSVSVMPPAPVRQLGPGAASALVEYLRKDTRPAEDDALLERAAHLGMAGAAPRVP